jgi:hypothetical protein
MRLEIRPKSRVIMNMKRTTTQPPHLLDHPFNLLRSADDDCRVLLANLSPLLRSELDLPNLAFVWIDHHS